MAQIQGTLEFADTDVFMEYRDWSLRDYSPKMDEQEFTIRETARSFEIDLDGKRVTYQFASEEEQLALDIAVEGWTAETLVLWLDRQVRQMDIHQSELLKWLRQLVDHLLNTRGMTIAALMRCKFLLAKKIENKIAAIRQKERSSVYQQYLLVPEGQYNGLVRRCLRICGTTCIGISDTIADAGNRASTFRPGSRSRL